MKLFLGVDGGQSGTTAVIGDETGRILGTGEAGPCNHAAAGEGRAKLERAVTGSVAAACAQAGLDAATVRFEAACFGMSGGPDDKREILAATLRVGAPGGDQRCGDRAGRRDRAPGRELSRSPVRGRSPSDGIRRAARRGRAAGATFSAMKAAASISRGRRLGRSCGWRKAGVRRPRCARCCWRRRGRRTPTRCCTVFTPTNGRDRGWRRWRAWWTRRRLESDAVALGILRGAAQQLAMLAGAVREELVVAAVGGGDRLHRRSVPEPDPAGELPDSGGVAGGRPLRSAAATVRRKARCARLTGALGWIRYVSGLGIE